VRRSREKRSESAILKILSPVRLPFRHTGVQWKTLIAKGPKRKRELARGFFNRQERQGRKVLRWEERDKRLVIKDAKLAASWPAARKLCGLPQPRWVLVRLGKNQQRFRLPLESRLRNTTGFRKNSPNFADGTPGAKRNVWWRAVVAE
jgi:hypothetical protein